MPTTLRVPLTLLACLLTVQIAGAQSAPVLLSPAPGASDVPTSTVFQWSSVSGALAYYLYVGTTLGSKDVVDSYEIQTTTLQVSNLPSGQPLYARIWAKLSDRWVYSDSTFVTRFMTGPHSQLLLPADGAMGVSAQPTFHWSEVDNVQAYYLYVGTTPGATDIVNTGEVQSTTHTGPVLPYGRLLHARMWTKVGGVWHFRDSSFTTEPLPALFPTLIAPANGATGVANPVRFHWTPVPNADRYYLYVGTSTGAKDVVNTGEIQVTSLTIGTLPPNQRLSVRIWSKVHGVWYYSDSFFTTAPNLATAVLTAPANGQENFDAAHPFRWEPVAGAEKYYVYAGSQPGAKDIVDSGELNGTTYFASQLPLNTTLFVRLWTRQDGIWLYRDSTFKASSRTAGFESRLTHVMAMTDAVRSMADSKNVVVPGTPLHRAVLERGRTLANCVDYATALTAMIQDANLGEARHVNIAFNSNGFEGHALVELYHPELLRWILFDPTMNLTMKRSVDGQFASVQDVSQATRTFDWSAITYVFLGKEGDQFARNYYVDYPLLFLNTYPLPVPFVFGQGESPLPYLQEVEAPVEGQRAGYIVRDVTSADAEVLMDGVRTVLATNGIDGTSKVELASSVARSAATGANVRVYRLRRYVF